MTYFKGGILVTILVIPIGIWLENSLPFYGLPLGVGIALAFILGVFSDIND